MSPRSVFLARLYGLFIVIFAIAISVQPEASTATLAKLCRDPVALMLSGWFGLVAGLAMVLGHNIWHGGGATILVTLLGWLVLAKSAVTLMLPAGIIATLYDRAGYADHVFVYVGVYLIIGAYLTWCGYHPRPETESDV